MALFIVKGNAPIQIQISPIVGLVEPSARQVLRVREVCASSPAQQAKAAVMGSAAPSKQIANIAALVTTPVLHNKSVWQGVAMHRAKTAFFCAQESASTHAKIALIAALVTTLVQPPIFAAMDNAPPIAHKDSPSAVSFARISNPHERIAVPAVILAATAKSVATEAAKALVRINRRIVAGNACTPIRITRIVGRAITPVPKARSAPMVRVLQTATPSSPTAMADVQVSKQTA